jgi:molecular chaperone DnaK (HSP70)
VLIPAGAAFPAEHEKPFTTVADGQRAVEVRVVRCSGGGKPFGLLGRFLLAGFRPGPRGAVRIDIGLAMDTAGIVRAWARDRETGAREECVFASTEVLRPLAAFAGEVGARKRTRGAGAIAVEAKSAKCRVGEGREGIEGV